MESANPGADGANLLVSRLLAHAREHLDMDVAWMSSFDRDDQVLEAVEHAESSTLPIHVGDQRPLTDTYCARVLAGDLPNVIPDTLGNETAMSMGPTNLYGIRAYVGVPILNENEPIGMVCCVDGEPRSDLDSNATQSLELVSKLIADVLMGRAPAIRREREVRRRISSAIGDDSFHTVFEPVVSLDSGKVIGAEALTRFRDPQQTTESWFSDAQSVGMAAELEIATVGKALSQLDSLPSHLYLGVNASPVALKDPRLTECILASDPNRIVLEITEHDAIDDYAALLATLEVLRATGVRIAVDDVGAGFSSFTHVLELSPHMLKLDISITRGIDTDPARRALAHAAVEVADRLGAAVIAEGVETHAELAAVASVGVTAAQGHLFQEPAPLPMREIEIPVARSTVAGSRRSDTDEDTDGGRDSRDIDTRQFQLAMLHSPIGICLVDPDGAFLHVNPALSAMLGYSPTELLGKSMQELSHPDDLATDLDLMAQCKAGTRNSYRLEKRYLREDGTTVWADLSVVAVRSRSGSVRFFLSQVLDVTERHEREALLALQAKTDHLTGLVNRAHLGELLDELDKTMDPFGLLFCDVADFKGVNDRLGHGAGDQVLRTVGRRIHRMIRDTDTVARWGGDEFVVVMPGADGNALEETARRIQASCDRHISLEGSADLDGVRIAIGIAIREKGDDISVHEVLHDADLDMYRRRAQDPATPSPREVR